tara:strand:- start:264 stop:563 length:300 start_codon:yes stop_codon:yes gene_type:complete
MHTKIITTREQELTEGNYVEGVVVKFADKYFWLLENGDCTETEVSEADLNCADEFTAAQVFDAITLADKIDLHYSVDKVAEFAEDLYTATTDIKYKADV